MRRSGQHRSLGIREREEAAVQGTDAHYQVDTATPLGTSQDFIHITALVLPGEDAPSNCVNFAIVALVENLSARAIRIHVTGVRQSGDEPVIGM